MRTTITIPEPLLEQAQKLSGRSGYSDAIVTALRNYVTLTERLAYLQHLFRKKPPHSPAAIKANRRQRSWSS